MHKPDFTFASSASIENALSERIEQIRLQRNLTQQTLAEMAGISRSTVTRLRQNDRGISLDSFIRLLQALQLEDHLHTLLPDPGISPLESLETKGQGRQRARPKKHDHKAWTWKTEGDRE